MLYEVGYNIHEDIYTHIEGGYFFETYQLFFSKTFFYQLVNIDHHWWNECTTTHRNYFWNWYHIIKSKTAIFQDIGTLEVAYGIMGMHRSPLDEATGWHVWKDSLMSDSIAFLRPNCEFLQPASFSGDQLQQQHTINPQWDSSSHSSHSWWTLLHTGNCLDLSRQYCM